MLRAFCLLALTLCFTPGDGLAQSVAYGIKGGIGMAGQGGRDAGIVAYRTGLIGGGFAEIQATPFLSFQPELYFTQKGARYAGSTDSFSYLEAPLLVKWEPSLPTGPLQPTLFAGPTVALLLSAREGDAKAKHLYRSFDYGIAFGAGVGYDRFSLDARYHLGLTSIVKPIGGLESDYRNRVFYLLLGYRIF